MRYILLLSLAVLLYSSEKFVLIANKNFPLEKLNKDQIKQIYLKKLRFIDGVQIIPINYTPRDLLRKEFENKILQIPPKKLKRYWMKKHYQGTRPPLTQSSSKSAILFVKKVDGAIAYIPHLELTQDIKVIYK